MLFAESSKSTYFTRRIKSKLLFLKLLATEFKPQRFEFFTAYSNALIDFEEQCRQAELLDSNKSDEHKLAEPKKYLIHGRLMTEEEIKRLAYREPSRNLNKVLSERSAYSQSLINLLVSNECKVSLFFKIL